MNILILAWLLAYVYGVLANSSYFGKLVIYTNFKETHIYKMLCKSFSSSDSEVQKQFQKEGKNAPKMIKVYLLHNELFFLQSNVLQTKYNSKIVFHQF